MVRCVRLTLSFIDHAVGASLVILHVFDHHWLLWLLTRVIDLHLKLLQFEVLLILRLAARPCTGVVGLDQRQGHLLPHWSAHVQQL